MERGAHRSASALRFSKGCSSLNLDLIVAVEEVECCLCDDVFCKTIVGGCDGYYEVGRSEVRTNDCLVDGGGEKQASLDTH